MRRKILLLFPFFIFFLMLIKSFDFPDHQAIPAAFFSSLLLMPFVPENMVQRKKRVVKKRVVYEYEEVIEE